ncbi:hypothetical protein [Streptomyces sp. NPDC020742]|uniref:hypothetical protein n=1 Tax=unclassified Streptomyces TaxID=2593676 RepID=UPI0033E34240
MKKPDLLRLACRSLLAVSCMTALAVPAASAAERVPSADAQGRNGRCVVVYFDLGETLVHTDDAGSMRYMPGAAAYLRALRAHHIPVGLITNVPPSWGHTDAERAAKLKSEVAKGWKDSRPFAWSDFGDRIFTPRTEAERKPAPALWERARKAEGPCRVVYQAETTEEVQVGAAQGFLAYQIGRAHWPAYLPVPLVEAAAQLP